MSANPTDSLFCVTCNAVTLHVCLTHPRRECSACGTLRTAAGAILYGIEATP